ncbi:MAG: AmmeMemoRadiSam system radical SAM enzyme [Candidatus Pacearchaeota archaeon]
MEKRCILYKKQRKENKVKCLACSHYCVISNGKTGICGVRKNLDGNLFLLVYGKVAAMHIDPIEKKPLYHFLPGSYTYSIGTLGCNFKCEFCQNFDISQAHKKSIISFGVEISPEQIVKNALKTECKSVAYTYNEPIIFSEFVHDCAEIAHSKELKNVIVTNGYWSKESFEYLKDLIDAANIDLKGDDYFYKKYCGGNLEPVLETIKRCYNYGIHVEITTLIIDGLNDDDIVLKKIAMFIANLDKKIPWHISRFFPHYKMKDKRITSISSLNKAYYIGKKAGLINVYLGNI